MGVLIGGVASGVKDLLHLPKAAKFLGSCFALRRADVYVTAAHNIKGQELAELSVVSAADRQLYPVKGIETHERADVALITLTSVPPIQPFDGALPPYLGADFVAYGFPEHTHPDVGSVPTPRVFKGHIQRIIRNHKSYLGYEYNAVELSMPCPAGLSGGPCFRPHQMTVVGIVTENLDTTTTLQESVEEIVGDVRRQTTHFQRVISYGIAVDPGAIAEWLDARIPLAKP